MAAHTSSSLGDFAQYLTNKKRKLQDLDLNLKENDSFGAADVSADQLFRGCSIYVNGYTSPSISVLHRLVVLHGGRFCQYMDSKTSITHIVASSLVRIFYKLITESDLTLFYIQDPQKTH